MISSYFLREQQKQNISIKISYANYQKQHYFKIFEFIFTIITILTLRFKTVNHRNILF